MPPQPFPRGRLTTYDGDESAKYSLSLFFGHTYNPVPLPVLLHDILGRVCICVGHEKQNIHICLFANPRPCFLGVADKSVLPLFPDSFFLVCCAKCWINANQSIIRLIQLWRKLLYNFGPPRESKRRKTWAWIVWMQIWGKLVPSGSRVLFHTVWVVRICLLSQHFILKLSANLANCGVGYNNRAGDKNCILSNGSEGTTLCWIRWATPVASCRHPETVPLSYQYHPRQLYIMV